MGWPAAPTAASRARRRRIRTEEPIRSAVFTGNLVVIRTAVTFDSVSDSPSKQYRARKQATQYRRSNVAWPGQGRQNKVAKDQRGEENRNSLCPFDPLPFAFLVETLTASRHSSPDSR